MGRLQAVIYQVQRSALFSCFLVCVSTGSLASAQLSAGALLVETQQEYRAATEKLQPGDTIILANGVWKDFEIVFAGKGTVDKPISLTAETKGGR